MSKLPIHGEFDDEVPAREWPLPIYAELGSIGDLNVPTYK